MKPLSSLRSNFLSLFFFGLGGVIRSVAISYVLCTVITCDFWQTLDNFEVRRLFAVQHHHFRAKNDFIHVIMIPTVACYCWF